MNGTSDHVFAEQVRLMYGQTKRIIIGGLLTGFIFCLIVWDVIAHAYVLYWFALIVLFSALRGMAYLAFLQRQDEDSDLKLWNSTFLLLTAGYSVTMGAISIIFHLTNDTTYHLLVIAWLIAYSALAVSSYLMNFRAVLAVFIPVAIILIVSLSLAGTRLHLLSAAAVTIWFIVIFFTMLPVSKSMIRAIALNHQLGLEIEQRERLQEKLQELSITDSLTGLFNRRHFDNVYANELKRAKRARTKLSVVMVDIDCFKQFNDTYGHQAGDDCLRRVSEVIRQSMRRSGDILARYGGEEMIAALPDTNAEQTFQLAERIRIAVQQLAIPHAESAATNTDTVSISVGIATLEPDAPWDETDLLKKADEALYQAKANGRNRTVACTCQQKPGAGVRRK